MVQPIVFKNPIETFHPPGFGIGRAVIEMFDLGLDDSPGTLDARFQRAVESAVLQAPSPDFLGRVADRHDLGMSGGIVFLFAPITAPPDHHAIPHYDRSHGNISVSAGDFALVDSQTHEMIVRRFGRQFNSRFKKSLKEPIPIAGNSQGDIPQAVRGKSRTSVCARHFGWIQGEKLKEIWFIFKIFQHRIQPKGPCIAPWEFCNGLLIIPYRAIWIERQVVESGVMTRRTEIGRQARVSRKVRRWESVLRWIGGYRC